MPSCLPAAASRPTPRWRTRYLGPGWDLAKVRGTRFNTGDGIRMALAIGAASYGNWSGLPRGRLGAQCAGVRRSGRRRRLPEAQLSVRHHGQRHAAGASSTRAPISATTPTPNTAASFCNQPGQFAWQVFDRKVDAPAARRVPHPPGHQGQRRHARGACRQARGRRRRRPSWRRSTPTTPPSTTRRPVRSERQGRTLAPSGLPSTRPTGRTASTRRPSRPTP